MAILLYKKFFSLYTQSLHYNTFLSFFHKLIFILLTLFHHNFQNDSIIVKKEKEAVMAIKFTRSDDLDKMFEEFATLPKIEKIEFPDEKEKKIKKEQKAKKL